MTSGIFLCIAKEFGRSFFERWRIWSASLWGIGEETGRVLALEIQYRYGIPIFIKTWIRERIQDENDPYFPDEERVVYYIQELSNEKLQELLEQLVDRRDVFGNVSLAPGERENIINTMTTTRVDPHNNNAG
ncbi:MAG: hypothetical protein LBD54_01905 [Puniceicoccales bacterium]|jgi:hypothetical protein|nr:hypothetical protein [Puniceicoccales bacterium]